MTANLFPSLPLGCIVQWHRGPACEQCLNRYRINICKMSSTITPPPHTHTPWLQPQSWEAWLPPEHWCCLPLILFLGMSPRPATPAPPGLYSLVHLSGRPTPLDTPLNIPFRMLIPLPPVHIPCNSPSPFSCFAFSIVPTSFSHTTQFTCCFRMCPKCLVWALAYSSRFSINIHAINEQIKYFTYTQSPMTCEETTVARKKKIISHKTFKEFLHLDPCAMLSIVILTFDKGEKLFMLHSVPLDVDLQGKQQGE